MTREPQAMDYLWGFRAIANLLFFNKPVLKNCIVVVPLRENTEGSRYHAKFHISNKGL